MDQYKDITFKINSCDITLSLDFNSDDYFHLTNDDDYAFKYIKELVVSKRIDLNEEDLRTLYRKDGDSYTLLYNAIDENLETSSIQEVNTDANKIKWTANSVKLLITERLDRDSLFTNPTCRKKKIWEVISRIINDKTGLDATGLDCSNKYRKLLQRYKANKVKSVRNGEEAVTWEYYKLFDEVLGTKASILPAQNMLGSSLVIENEESDTTMEEPGRKDGESDTLLYNAIDESLQTSSTQTGNTEVNKNKWTANGVKILITERLERDNLFTHPTCKKQKIWDVISKVIKDKTGIVATGLDCNNKYRNLLQTYKANKIKSVRYGEEAITWEYYSLFDEVLGTNASSLPVQNMLGSSLDIENEESDTNMEEPGSSTFSRKRKTEEMKLERYLCIKQKRAEKMFEVKHQLKLKEIDAINNLAEAIRSIAENKK